MSLIEAAAQSTARARAGTAVNLIVLLLVSLVVVVHTNYWTIFNVLVCVRACLRVRVRVCAVLCAQGLSISLGLWIVFVAVYSSIWPKLGKHTNKTTVLPLWSAVGLRRGSKIEQNNSPFLAFSCAAAFVFFTGPSLGPDFVGIWAQMNQREVVTLTVFMLPVLPAVLCGN
jgi:hypothetical protein